MSYRYRLRLRPAARFYFSSPDQTAPTATALVNAVAGLVVHEHGSTDVGDHVFAVGVRRPTHEQALNELFAVTQQLGYAWAEATISEVTNDAIGGAVLGVLGGGGAGSRSENALITAFAAVIGGIAGTAIGSQIEHNKVIFQVHRTFPNGWTLVAFRPNENDAGDGRLSLA